MVKRALAKRRPYGAIPRRRSGKAVPICWVGREGRNWLMEVKDGENRTDKALCFADAGMNWTGLVKWEGQVANGV